MLNRLMGKEMKLLFTLLFAGLASNIAYAVKCADFKNQAEAQHYYEAGKRGGKRLDRDKDGEACECLPGGSKYHKSICKRFRKKYGK